MLTEATKKYREILAFGLLGVAALILLSGFSLLFKSEEDLGGRAGFADKSMLFGPLFSDVFLLAALVLAVVIVTVGEASRNAKPVVLGALGIGGVAALFAVITWFASYGVDRGFEQFGGIAGAGKIVGTLLNIAHLGLLGLALLFFFSVYQAFPKPAPAQQQWGQPGQQQWGQPGQQQWGQPAQGGWGQPGQQGYAAGWGDQAQQQGQQQGQPASAWGQQGWGQQPEQQQGWGAGPEPQQPGWGQQPEQQGQQWQASPGQGDAAAGGDQTQVWSGEGAADQGQEGEQRRRDDEQQPPQQGWWQQPQ